MGVWEHQAHAADRTLSITDFSFHTGRFEPSLLSYPAGRAWAVKAAERECQHVRNMLSRVTSLRCRGEGNQALKGGRQEGQELPGAAALLCSLSSEGRVKVFALWIITTDIWVLLSHALFFFFFLTFFL